MCVPEYIVAICQISLFCCCYVFMLTLIRHNRMIWGFKEWNVEKLCQNWIIILVLCSRQKDLFDFQTKLLFRLLWSLTLLYSTERCQCPDRFRVHVLYTAFVVLMWTDGEHVHSNVSRQAGFQLRETQMESHSRTSEVRRAHVLLCDASVCLNLQYKLVAARYWLPNMFSPELQTDVTCTHKNYTSWTKRCFQTVPHPSTKQVWSSLASEIWWVGHLQLTTTKMLKCSKKC